MSFTQLFTGATVTNGPPDTLTDGSSTGDLRAASQVMLLLNNPSGAGADSITVRMWGRSNENNETNVWYPIGTANQDNTPVLTNLTKGTINHGEAITVNGSPQNSAAHAELLSGVRGFSAIYAEIVAVTGTWDMSMATRDPGNRS